MTTTFETVIIGIGNHASIEISPENLAKIGGTKRAPLKITVNGYTYQSTATGVDGTCQVVFPMRDREAAGVQSGERVQVTLELDSGYRHVDVPDALQQALRAHGLVKAFHDLNFSERKALCRQVNETKSEETRARRIEKVIAAL